MSKSSERITEKRTVITSSSNYDDGDDSSIYYKSGIGPRQSTVVNRSSVSSGGLRSSMGGGGGGTVYKRTVEYGIGRSGLGNLSPGSYEKVSNTGVMTVKSSREKEKKDMQDLNERFANYIEKVRFLEAQNRKLAGELEHLKTKWGKETSAIKAMFEQELAEARKLIDDLTRDKNKLEIQNSSLQDEMNNMRRQMEDLKKYHSLDQEQINKLNQQLSDYESEINMLRRTISSLETERGRDKDRINKLQEEVDRLRIDLNNETLNHLDAENRRQTLEEEMEFLKKVHEQELKELAALAYRDTTEENREFWKSELSQAIRDIQSEYDNKVDQIRGDMESYYNLKVQEFRTGATKQNMEVTHVKEENKKLVKSISDLKGRLADLEARNAQLESQYNSLLREYESMQSEHTMETVKLKEEITNLRAEMEAILVELQSLMDAKLSLELEIAAYRKLLESEESRVDRLRRLGINVLNLRGSFRGTSADTKQDSEYSPEFTLDDEKTERDITPDDDQQDIIVTETQDFQLEEVTPQKSKVVESRVREEPQKDIADDKEASLVETGDDEKDNKDDKQINQTSYDEEKPDKGVDGRDSKDILSDIQQGKVGEIVHQIESLHTETEPPITQNKASSDKPVDEIVHQEESSYTETEPPINHKTSTDESVENNVYQKESSPLKTESPVIQKTPTDETIEESVHQKKSSPLETVQPVIQKTPTDKLVEESVHQKESSQLETEPPVIQKTPTDESVEEIIHQKESSPLKTEPTVTENKIPIDSIEDIPTVDKDIDEGQQDVIREEIMKDQENPTERLISDEAVIDATTGESQDKEVVGEEQSSDKTVTDEDAATTRDDRSHIREEEPNIVQKDDKSETSHEVDEKVEKYLRISERQPDDDDMKDSGKIATPDRDDADATTQGDSPEGQELKDEKESNNISQEPDIAASGPASKHDDEKLRDQEQSIDHSHKEEEEHNVSDKTADNLPSTNSGKQTIGEISATDISTTEAEGDETKDSSLDESKDQTFGTTETKDKHISKQAELGKDDQPADSVIIENISKEINVESESDNQTKELQSSTLEDKSTKEHLVSENQSKEPQSVSSKVDDQDTNISDSHGQTKVEDAPTVVEIDSITTEAKKEEQDTSTTVIDIEKQDKSEFENQIEKQGTREVENQSKGDYVSLTDSQPKEQTDILSETETNLQDSIVSTLEQTEQKTSTVSDTEIFEKEINKPEAKRKEEDQETGSSASESKKENQGISENEDKEQNASKEDEVSQGNDNKTLESNIKGKDSKVNEKPQSPTVESPPKDTEITEHENDERSEKQTMIVAEMPSSKEEKHDIADQKDQTDTGVDGASISSDTVNEKDIDTKSKDVTVDDTAKANIPTKEEIGKEEIIVDETHDSTRTENGELVQSIDRRVSEMENVNQEQVIESSSSTKQMSEFQSSELQQIKQTDKNYEVESSAKIESKEQSHEINESIKTEISDEHKKLEVEERVSSKSIHQSHESEVKVSVRQNEGTIKETTQTVMNGKLEADKKITVNGVSTEQLVDGSRDEPTLNGSDDEVHSPPYNRSHIIERIRGAGFYRRNNEDSYPIDMIDTVEVEIPHDSVQPETGDPDEPPDLDSKPEDTHSSMKMMRGEVSAKTTYQKTSTGPVSIAEVSPEGKFITLENTSSQRREVNLDGWKIKRELDGQREIVYTFRNFTLKPHKSVKIYARGSASEAGINDLVFRDEDTWGVGSQVSTTLVNEKAEEKATHKQRTAYN